MRYFNLLLTLIIAMSFSIPSSAFTAGKFERELKLEAKAVKLAQEIQEGGYEVISTPELKKMIDEKKDILIIDTMPYEASYKKNHIPGAKQFLFPIKPMKKWNIKETAGKTKKDFTALLGNDHKKTIIVYCGFVKCTRSHNGALWAKKLGYENVYRLPGGIFAWKGAGYTVEKEN